MTSTSTNCAAELADFAQPEKKGGRSPREERIIAGFEEIQRFVEKHGRAPQHGEDRDIFERLYAVRLDRLRALEDCRSLLAPLDHQGLLAGAETARCRAGGDDRRRRTAGRAGGRGGRGRHHRTAACPHQRRQARRRGNRQPHSLRGLRDSSSRCSSRCKRELEIRRPADAPVRLDELKMAEIQTGRVLHRRRPERLCRRNGRGFHDAI